MPGNGSARNTRANPAAADELNLSAEMKEYFENLMAQHTQTILNRVEALEKRIQEKYCIIEELKVEKEELKERVSYMEKNVFVAIDDAEQYGRRMNIRLENIPYSSDETNATLKTKIETALEQCGVEVNDGMLVRWHRSGRPYSLENKDGTTTKVAQTILKFSTWEPRRQAHRSKAKIKDDDLPYIVRHDLTKRRFSLLKEAMTELKKWKLQHT